MISERTLILTNKNAESDHSVGPDVLTGWCQRETIQKLRQIPLIFSNNSIDLISKSLTSFGSTHTFRVVYMGPRHLSNLRAFRAYGWNKNSENVIESDVYGVENVQRFEFKHSHEKEKYFPIRVSEYRLFTGMNPTCQRTDIRFQSDFQCGNLDLAIYISLVQYDLLMRVDSNTRGHTNWFFFKVSNVPSNHKIKFNIINFVKKLALYKEGMKPYVYKKSQGKWSQEGINVQFKKKVPRYEDSDKPSTMGNLSFTYHFTDEQQVYFAYCVPYSYSYLLHFLNIMKTKYPHLIKLSMEYQSTGGITIPVLTITNFSTDNFKKKTHLCIGRQHPGEAQGSWMMEGFVRYLCSPEGHYLRERAVFKIVPMLNVDGVVLGNYRTGISGRDLNRVFCSPERYQEIKLIRDLASKFKPMIFLDFHGHSAKRNVFLYGPDYRLEDRHYLNSRIFPKMIAKRTAAFRYYSCSFKISTIKSTTGRAVMLRQYQTAFSFTIQASNFCYGPIQNVVLFDSLQYMEVGLNIGKALTDFIGFLLIMPKRIELQNAKKKQQECNRHSQKINIHLEQQNSNSNMVEGYQIPVDQLLFEQLELIKQIMEKGQAEKFDDAKQQNGAQQESDCEDETDDYSEKQLQRYFNDNAIIQGHQKSIQRTKTNKSPNPNKHKKKHKDRSSELRKIHTIQQELVVSKSMVSNRRTPINTQKRDSSQLPNQSQIMIKLKSQLLRSQKNIDHQRQSFKLFEPTQNEISNIIHGVHQQPIQKPYGKMNNLIYDWQGKSRSKSTFVKQVSLNTLNMSPEQFQKVQFLEKRKKRNGETFKIRHQANSAIKRSVLPLLNRNGTYTQLQQKNILSQILQEHERRKRGKISFQYKIFHV